MTTTLETVSSADGTTITLERAGDGPPVILIGGAFNDRTTVGGLAATLAPRFTAVAYDRRGRGDSSDADATQAVAEAIPGARYATIDGQDHGILNQPEALRPLLVEFLT